MSVGAWRGTERLFMRACGARNEIWRDRGTGSRRYASTNERRAFGVSHAFSRHHFTEHVKGEYMRVVMPPWTFIVDASRWLLNNCANGRPAFLSVVHLLSSIARSTEHVMMIYPSRYANFAIHHNVPRHPTHPSEHHNDCEWRDKLVVYIIIV